MKVQTTTTIKLTVKGTEFEVTEAEAKELRDALNKAFPVEKVTGVTKRNPLDGYRDWMKPRGTGPQFPDAVPFYPAGPSTPLVPGFERFVVTCRAADGN